MGQIVEAINGQGLLEDDELELIDALLGDLKSRVAKMPEEARSDYLDAGWQFSVRLGTLVFERLARRRLTENGWVLFDFEQARSHRSDFLAYKNGKWLLLAARVQPSKSKTVRKRLQRGGSPFDATPTLVVPDKRSFTPDDEYASVPVLTLEELLGGAD